MEQSSLDDLRGVLTRVRRRWITANSMRAGTRAVVVALALLLVILATDHFLEPADVAIVVLAIAACVGAVTFAIRTLWPLRRIPSDTQVARFIEEQCPDLEDRLASATEVAGSGHPSALGGLVLVDAAAKVRSVDVDRVVASDHVWGSILRGAAATVAFLVVFAAGSDSVSRIARTAWLYAFPYTVTLEIEPGDARVVAGESMAIVARLGGTIGAPSRTPPSVMLTDVDGQTHTVDMDAADGDEYRAVMPPVTDDFTYHVSAATLMSDEYSVTALFPPGVDRIDVAYQYPPFTQLPPRVETDGGDVYAPAGTQVTLTVRTDKAVRRGGLDLEVGGRMPLVVMDDRTLQTSFTVSGDDSYRVALVDNDGLSSPADVDYFIRTVLDRPPNVEITRPAGDLDITPLEEAVIEASARDDFGLERFELVYAVVGEPERSVDLLSDGSRRSVTAGYTIYGEDLELEPGDFISYYARALDTNTGDGAGEVRSDIYFLQVRPFDQEFEGAQSQSTSSMDAGELGDFAGLQKEIIVATWRLDRQRADARRTDDVNAVADAQEELRWATSRLAQQLLARERRGPPQTRGRSRTEVQVLRDAVAAMTEAEISLRAEETSRAIPSEMDALDHLLKAEAEVRRRQANTQQSGAGRRGESQAREDLSALFDQELRRDQQTNYETRSPSETDDETRDETEARQRLRELAERQQDLSRDQAELASSEADITDEERRRQLDRLTREQNQLRVELEALARDLERLERNSGMQQLASAAEVSDRMRRATSDLSRGDVSQAAREGQQAAERLRDMQRQIEGRSGGGGAALGELQLEARQLGDQQRQMASDTRQSEPGLGGQATRAGLATRGDQLADRIDSLEDRMQDLLPRTLEETQAALRGALEELRTANAAGETREMANRLRRAAVPPESSDAERDDEVEAIAADADVLAEALDQVAQRLAAGRAQSATAQRLAEELEAAWAVRRSLDAIEARLRQAAAAGGGLVQDNPAAPEDGDSGGADGQAEVRPPSSSDGSPSPGQSGSDVSRELARLQERLMRQLAESTQLLEQLRRQRPEAEQDLERWAQQWQSGPAPGTEAAKQDFSAWESLRDDLLVALEAFEALRSRDLREEEIGDRLTVGPSDQTPDAYRRLVERYYQSLATESERP